MTKHVVVAYYLTKHKEKKWWHKTYVACSHTRTFSTWLYYFKLCSVYGSF